MSEFDTLKGELAAKFEVFKTASKDLVGVHRKLEKFYGKKREHEEEEEEEEKPTPVAVATPDFVCSGRVWDNGAPCPGGKRANIKAGLLYEKKRYVVCKECKLAWDSLKRAQKKAKTENGAEPVQK